jgi:hypothetical protein
MGILAAGIAVGVGALLAQDKTYPQATPLLVCTRPLQTLMARMPAAKDESTNVEKTLLEARYDLSDRPAPGVTMSRSKALQRACASNLLRESLRMNWRSLLPTTSKPATSSQPGSFLFLAPNHPEGRMLFLRRRPLRKQPAHGGKFLRPLAGDGQRVERRLAIALFDQCGPRSVQIALKLLF